MSASPVPLSELRLDVASPPSDDLDGVLDRITGLMYRASGVSLTEKKKGLVRARLAKRLRVLGLSTFQEYVELVEGPGGGEELGAMVDLLTTNKTSFFREATHFDFLRDHVLPELGSREPVRIWSAGCSSGEEPYTLAAVLTEAGVRDARILATDISSAMVRAARAATYPAARTGEIEPGMRARMFEKGDDETVRVREELRRMVRVGRLNLLGPWPMRGPFQAIFCRNVMIYFESETREALVNRFAGLLAPGGHLFVGHSESLHALDHPLRYVRPAVYRR